MKIDDETRPVLVYALRVAIAKDEMQWAEENLEWDKEKLGSIERRLDAMRDMLDEIL